MAGVSGEEPGVVKLRNIKGRHPCPVCGQLVFFTRRGRPYHQHLRGKAHIEAERAQNGRAK